jgi:hypothetical protein
MTAIGKGKRQYRVRFEDRPSPAGRLCPACSRRMRQREQIFAVYVPPGGTLEVSVLCRYCSTCELLQARWESIESRLAVENLLSRPEATGGHYIILGTVDAPGAVSPSGCPLPAELLPDVLHEFHEVIRPQGRSLEAHQRS